MIEGNISLGVLVLVPGHLVLGVALPLAGKMVQDLGVLGPPLVAVVLALAHCPAFGGDGVPGQCGGLGGYPPALAGGEQVNAPDDGRKIWIGKALALLHVAGLVVDVVLVLDDAGQAGRHAIENLLQLGTLLEVLPVVQLQGCVRSLESRNNPSDLLLEGLELAALFLDNLLQADVILDQLVQDVSLRSLLVRTGPSFLPTFLL